MLIQTLKKHRFLIILALLFLILRLPSLFEPNWYGDEGVYLVLGQAIRKGVLLYAKIHDNKPPTLYYLAALSQTVFGFRLLLSLWMIPTVYIFNLLSKKFLPHPLYKLSTLIFLLITSIPLFEGTIANAEIFMVLPTILGVYLIYNHFGSGLSIKVLAMSGLLLGFAFTIKVPVAVEFIFLCLWLLIFGLKNLRLTISHLLIFSVAFVVPICLYAIYFYSHGAFNDFIYASLLQNFGYLSSWTTGSHSGSATGGGLLTRGVILLIFWAFTYFLLIKKTISKKLAFISFWFSATIFGALLSTRPYPHYLIPVIPPLALLLVTIFDSKIRRYLKIYLISLFLFLCFLFHHYQFYVYPVFSYYKNFYTHLTSLNSSYYRNYFGSDINNIYSISAYVSHLISPTDYLFVWGDSPFIYALTNHLPVGRFTVAYHIVDFNQYQTVYNQLKIDFPKIIVYYQQPGRPYPELDDFISRYYVAVKTFNTTIIFQRRD
jgi:4-amino-4-deoxy-L-arabinose transferase-like glycosyltransferase